MSEYLEKILKDVKAKNPNEPEFHQGSWLVAALPHQPQSPPSRYG